MIIKDVLETESWLSERKIKWCGDSIKDSEYLILPRKGCRTIFNQPLNPSTCTVLSTEVSSWFKYKQAFLWISKWTGFEPLEMSVLQSIRRCYGSVKELIDYPSHVFVEKDDINDRDIAEMLLLMTLFNWQCYLLSEDVGTIIWFADEIVEVWTQDEGDHRTLDVILDRLQIERV